MANFKPKHVILSFRIVLLHLQALHKPYVLIKQHIKSFKSNALDFPLPALNKRSYSLLPLLGFSSLWPGDDLGLQLSAVSEPG